MFQIVYQLVINCLCQNSSLNDKQIRLEILLDYYKSTRNQTGISNQKDNEIREIDSEDYDFNYGVLVKFDLNFMFDL